jgi:lysozyme
MNALGCDISYWQGTVDFAKMATAAKFVILRGYFSASKDTRFDGYYDGAGSAGLLRGMYHFVDYRANPVTQATYLANLYKDHPTEIPPVCDLEIYSPFGGLTRDRAHYFLVRYLEAIINQTGRVPLLYTNLNLINIMSPLPTWLTGYPLWIAYWSATATTPSIGGFPDWFFWQWTDKGAGADYGVSSGNIDLDRFNGDYEALRRFCGLEVQPEPEPTDVEKLALLWGAHPELH